MQIAVTFRHMETSDAVRNYLEEKLSRVKKYIDEPIDAQRREDPSATGGHAPLPLLSLLLHLTASR